MDSVVDKSCRICLGTNYTDFASFDDEGKWLEMYEFCFEVKLSNKDMPRKVCSECAGKMKDFSELKKLAQKSDKLWKTIGEIEPQVFKASMNDVELLKNTEDEVCVLDSSDQEEENQLSDSQLSIKDEEIDCKEHLDNDDNECIENKIDTKLNNESPENVFCDKCKMRFKYYSSYETHLQQKDCRVPKSEEASDLPDLVKLQNPCGLCDMPDFLTWNDLKAHLGKHRENNDLSCKLCEYVGRDFADMVSHRFIHTNPKLSAKRCYVCHKTCWNALILQFHFRKMHLRKESGGWCSVCSKEFCSYKTFRNHVRRHDNPNFICDHCGKTFLFKHSIVEHMQCHLDIKAFVCDLCGKAFVRRSNLTSHQRSVHDNVTVTCKHCNKLFKNQKNLDLHLRLLSKKKEHQCHVCSKEYYHASDLKAHMIWHEDRRPFSCDTCGKSFKIKRQLTIHIRSHTGYKPHQCPFCPAAFTNTNQVKVHSAVHTGKRRYQCPYCHRSFHQKRLLREHCEKDHDVTDFKVTKEEER